MVYPGGGIGVHNWRDILFMAPDEVFACSLALVCDWGQCVLLFRSPVWMYPGFVKEVYYGI